MASAHLELLLRSPDASWDYARWERLPDDGNRYEVIDGVLYMSTSPSLFHEWIIKRLMRHVGDPLEDRGVAFAFSSRAGLLMPGCDPAQPDFLVVRSERAEILSEGRVRGVPDLIAEVLSPGNAEQDMSVKRGTYARAGVPEYWIVRPSARDVPVYTQPDVSSGTYAHTAIVPSDGVLESPTLPVSFAVADLFAGAPDTTL
ncbi:MAG TPA: Uma2 family endonuclease [Thermomicrobiales bacterium]|nr:Uma2 family endonuclease [Thermomicrobiales bacterium]